MPKALDEEPRHPRHWAWLFLMSHGRLIGYAEQLGVDLTAARERIAELEAQLAGGADRGAEE